MDARKLLFLVIAISALGCMYLMMFQDPSLFRNASLETPCHGHLFLCSYKRLLVDRHIYGNISFPSNDIYNFSRLEHFRTNYFRSDPLRNATFQLMDSIRTHIKREFQDEWLNRNLVYRKIKKTDSSPFCSFSPFRYYGYSYKYNGIINQNPLKVSLIIEENNLTSFTPPHLWPHIHAEISTPRTKAACTRVDYINDRYYVECPILEPRFIISIRASYLGPSIYVFVCKKKDNWLLKTFSNSDLERQGLDHKNVIYSDLNLPKCSKYIAPKGIGFWMKLSSIWHYATEECYFSFTFMNSTKECLKEKTVLMIGDSHTIYRERSLRQYGILNATIIKTTIASEMVARLRFYSHQLMKKSNVVIVFNSGHWSFRHLDVSTYISDMLEAVEIIQQMKNSNPSPQFIWVESSAVTFNDHHFRAKVNSYIAAMNDWVNYNMRKLGVKVVPAFDISLPMSDHTRDGAHYAQLLEEDVKNNKHKVSVGGAISSVLIHTICPESI